MQRRGTVILFLIAAALAGYYLLVERQRGDDTSGAQLFVTLSPEAVERLSIQRDDETLEFVRVDTHWELVRPVRDLADASTVMRLLTALAGAKVERDIGAQDDLAPYGLDSPIAVRAEQTGAPTVSVLVGGYTVDHALSYAMVEGGASVALVPTTIRRYAATAVEDFRYKRVATFDISLVDSFRVITPSRSMAWHRDAAGWITTAGADTIRGNGGAVEGVLRRVRAMRAIGFPPSRVDVADPGRVSVSVYRRSPLPAQIITAVPHPPSFVVDIQPEDRQVLVDSTDLELFGFTVEQLRERHLLRFDPARVARVEFQTDDTIITLVRSAGGWTVPNPAMGDLDGDLVRAALGASAALELDRVRSEQEPAALSGVTFTLAVLDDGGTIIDELRCRLVPGDSVAVATSRSSRLAAEVAAWKLRRLEERFQRIQAR